MVLSVDWAGSVVSISTGSLPSVVTSVPPAFISSSAALVVVDDVVFEPLSVISSLPLSSEGTRINAASAITATAPIRAGSGRKPNILIGSWLLLCTFR